MKDNEMNKVIGKYIEAARVQKGFTQNELADLISVSRNLITAIENGERSCSMAQGIKIAKALGITMDQLLQDSIPWNEEFQSVIKIKDVYSAQEAITNALCKLRESIF